MTRKKTTKPAREWIGDWTVTYEWDWRGQLLKSRQHDFRIAEENSRRQSTWFMFNRHVINNDNGAVWVDGFDPNGGFVSYRPEQIIAVRPHRATARELKRNGDQPGKPTPRARQTRRKT